MATWPAVVKTLILAALNVEYEYMLIYLFKHFHGFGVKNHTYHFNIVRYNTSEQDADIMRCCFLMCLLKQLVFLVFSLQKSGFIYFPPLFVV